MLFKILFSLLFIAFIAVIGFNCVKSCIAAAKKEKARILAKRAEKQKNENVEKEDKENEKWHVIKVRRSFTKVR